MTINIIFTRFSSPNMDSTTNSPAFFSNMSTKSASIFSVNNNPQPSLSMTNTTTFSFSEPGCYFPGTESGVSSSTPPSTIYLVTMGNSVFTEAKIFEYSLSPSKPVFNKTPTTSARSNIFGGLPASTSLGHPQPLERIVFGPNTAIQFNSFASPQTTQPQHPSFVKKNVFGSSTGNQGNSIFGNESSQQASGSIFGGPSTSPDLAFNNFSQPTLSSSSYANIFRHLQSQASPVQSKNNNIIESLQSGNFFGNHAPKIKMVTFSQK